MNPDLYLRVREKEGRVYTDNIVRDLPIVPDGYPLADEWKARSASASRLRRYLARFSRRLTILDLGCGNGWLANLLAQSAHKVVGLDHNIYELKQAARVFSKNTDVLFMEADIFSAPFERESFDIVILASSIQYFSDLHMLFRTLCKYLSGPGEIHILDSPLYRDQDVESAIERSREYYAALGFPDMANRYFHHRLSSLTVFRPRILYQPNHKVLQIKHFLKRVDSPFPWLSIQKQNIP
jgi:SAM-dependent methyltransferase